MTTDLLGDPVADPPPMNAPLPWRVFQVNDQPEYYVARTLGDARKAAAEDWGDWNPELTEDAFELSDESLAKLTINISDECEPPEVMTFRAYLDSMLPRLTRAEFFAGVE